MRTKNNHMADLQQFLQKTFEANEKQRWVTMQCDYKKKIQADTKQPSLLHEKDITWTRSICHSTVIKPFPA